MEIVIIHVEVVCHPDARVHSHAPLLFMSSVIFEGIRMPSLSWSEMPENSWGDVRAVCTHATHV